MARSATPHQRAAALHAGAVIVAVVSGACALVALAAGSPLQFGTALAVFGAGWIVADFFQSTAGREPGVQQYAVQAARLQPGRETCRVVHLGGGEHFSLPAPRTGQGLAA